jgi:alpha-L-arabinofuranosidase
VKAAEIRLNGMDANGTAKVITLAADPLAENSFDHPTAVAPADSMAEVRAGKIAAGLKPFSVTVFRVPTGNERAGLH